MAFCDDRRLAQVLRALVDNAVKFSPDGGTVVDRGLDATPHGDRDRRATRAPACRARNSSRIFERFYRGTAGSDTKQGTGLGLSIARDMAELMGGTLTVRSEPGGGAEFTFQVPRLGSPTGA